MRRLIVTTGMIFLLLSFTYSVGLVPSAKSQPPPSSQANQVLGDARLSLMQGEVVIQTGDTGSEWGAATINTPLMPGTKLWNPENGRSEVQFSGGSSLRASENTEVDITNLSMGSSGDIIQVGVPQGRTYVNYAGSNVQNSVFQVDTPVTSAMSYESSKFQVDVFEDGYTEISVLRGALYVQSQNGSTRIDAGTMISMGSDQNAEISPTRPQDAWLSWNLSRDSALASRGPGSKYLPAPLRAYGSDFDTYGRWVNTPDYGYVWTPTITVSDWAPYRVGRWTWVGNDYVWISYEPWGWVPYHYGRWAFVARTGWCWVPPAATAAVYWSPGFVAWVQGPNYVSWVPLAPGEIYYGYGYYGPHSVNITNININRISVKNVYVNARVRNAVTVVNRETFVTGRRVKAVNAPSNPFLSARTKEAGARFAFGRPDIKPERATRLPDPVKVVHERVLPPKEVRAKAETVQHRVVATKKDVSVFKAGERLERPLRVEKRDRPKPLTAVEKHGLPQALSKETGKPSGRKEEATVPSERKQERERTATPQERRREVSPPSGQRERGVAPQFEEQRPQQKPEADPSMRREEMAKPPAEREQMGKPPVQEKRSPGQGMTKPPVQREQQSRPPERKEKMVKPPAPRGEVVKPPVQREQPVRPPAQREQMSRPPVQREEMRKPSVQREMGVAPRFGEQRTSPPARREPMNKSEPRKVKPPVQSETGRPPVHGGEKN